MSDVAIVVAGVDISDDVVFEFTEFRSQVNGKPGDARMRVRDLDSTYAFTNGDDWLLTVDGQAVWRGYVMGITRTYIAPAMDVAESGLQRFWDLVGSDLNLLFAKRILFKTATPAVVEGTQFPPATADTTAITELLANWIDLSSDDLDTTSGVVHVGDLDPAQDTRAWSGGWQWGQGMDAIAKLPGAIYYLRPEVGSPRGTLVFCDVDTPSAAFGLSDTYNGTTTKGYREMEITKDGTSLANDVLAWGMGYGSQTPVFVRDQDATSQTTHGLWQTGQVTVGVYKQTTINRIAASIIDGSPENKRGSKDDRVSVQLTTYEPGLLCGDKVAFTASMFGFSDTIPVRSMRVSFESPTAPRYEVILSHDIDAPWGFVDQFWPDFPTFAGGGGVPRPGGWTQQIGGECECGITDSFTRVVASGWGISDVGIPWITFIDNGDQSVDNGIGTISTSAADKQTSMRLTTELPSTITATVKFRSNQAPSDLAPRIGTLNDVTLASMSFNSTTAFSSPNVQIFAERTGAGLFTYVQFFRNNFDKVTCPIAINANTWYYLKLSTEPGQPLRAKVWAEGDDEPATWVTSVTETGPSRTFFALTLGHISQEDSALTLITDYDDLSIPGIDRCTAAQFDDFERTTPGGAGVMDWSSTTPSGYPWLSDPYSAQMNFSVSAGNGVAYTSASAAPGVSVENFEGVAGDFTMTAQVRFYQASSSGTLGYNYAFRVLAGAVGSGYLGGSFYCRVDGFNTALTAPAITLTYGTTSPTVVSTPFTLGWGEWYWLKWQRTGTSHRMKLWLTTAAEPDWLLEQSGIPAFTPGRFGYAMQGRPDTAMHVASIDFDYDGKPCYWGESELVLDSFDNRTVAPDESADLGTATSGYVWSGSSFFPATPATVEIDAGHLIFTGYSGSFGAAIWEYSLDAGATVVEMEKMAEYEFRFKTSLVTDADTYIKTQFGPAELWLRLSNSGTNQIDVGSGPPDYAPESYQVTKTNWVANSWYTVKAVIEGPDARLKLWRDEVDNEPSTYIAAGYVGTPVDPGDGGQWFLRPEFGYDPAVRGGGHTITIDYALIRYMETFEAGEAGLATFASGTSGFGCENATRVSSTEYRTSTTYASNSTFVWIDGLMQRRGTDFTEDTDLRTLTFGTAVSAGSSVRTCYVAQALP